MRRRFGSDEHQAAHHIAQWLEHREHGLSSEDLIANYTSADEPYFRERAWEVLVAQYLRVSGHQLRAGPNAPDFLMEYAGRRVWVEAICPRPTGIPKEALDYNASGYVAPFKQQGLRWTAAFKEKKDKLTKYEADEIVRPDDAYIIAINSSRLGVAQPDHGISRYPFALETVYPLGPIALELDEARRRIVGAQQTERRFILNHNNVEIPTTAFLDPANNGVTAIIGCARTGYRDPARGLFLVHNAFARAPIPPGFLADAEEWVATLVDNDTAVDILKVSA